MTASVNVPQSVLDEGTYYTDQSTKISWQNMEILSRQGSFYIVKATLPVAEEITHLQAAGNAQFSMVLRPDADTRVLDVSSLGCDDQPDHRALRPAGPRELPEGRRPDRQPAADPADHARAVDRPAAVGRSRAAVRERGTLSHARCARLAGALPRAGHAVRPALPPAVPPRRPVTPRQGGGPAAVGPGRTPHRRPPPSRVADPTRLPPPGRACPVGRRSVSP